MSTIVRWRPVSNRLGLWNEFDRMFDEAFNNMMPLRRWQEPTSWGLALDMTENDETYMIKASMPGVNLDDIDISLADNVLTIKGEVKSDETIEEEQYHIRERRFGSFSRSVTLPTAVNRDEVEASYENGVLTITVPKAEEMKPRRIAIKSGPKVIEGKTS